MLQVNIIKIIPSLHMLLFFALSSFQIQALSPADRDAVIQLQQQWLEQDQQQRDEMMRTLQPAIPAPSNPDPDSGRCFTLTRITLEGSSLLSGRARTRLTTAVRACRK